MAAALTCNAPQEDGRRELAKPLEKEETAQQRLAESTSIPPRARKISSQPDKVKLDGLGTFFVCAWDCWRLPLWCVLLKSKEKAKKKKRKSKDKSAYCVSQVVAKYRKEIMKSIHHNHTIRYI